MLSQKRLKGISRNKTNLLLLCKEGKRKKMSRFAKQTLSMDQPVKASNLRVPLVELERMPTMPTLPPEWVDKHQECIELLHSIHELKKRIMTEQGRRLSCVKESDEKDSERKIYELTSAATSKLRKCEKNLNEIKALSQPQSQADQKTCKNICLKLALDIQEITRELRGQQRAFIDQRKQIESTTKVSFLQLAAERAFDYDDEQYQEEQQIQQQMFVERNEEIMKIVESVQQLNGIYKELNNLVIIQGSLLDRIDFNIDESLVQVKKGDQTLTRVQEKQRTSKCACRMIIIMVLGIVILGIILLVRWLN